LEPTKEEVTRQWRKGVSGRFLVGVGCMILYDFL